MEMFWRWFHEKLILKRMASEKQPHFSRALARYKNILKLNPANDISTCFDGESLFIAIIPHTL